MTVKLNRELILLALITELAPIAVILLEATTLLAEIIEPVPEVVILLEVVIIPAVITLVVVWDK